MLHPDSELPQHFDASVLPDGAVEGCWHAADGRAIRRLDWPAPEGARVRGSLLFLVGRGDAYEKYLEGFAHWHAHGWRVTALDWRGQAGSGREGLDADTGHIADFALWVADLARFWSEWSGEVEGPLVLVAHSMGGHIALRALAEGVIAPAAAVLIAPMLGFRLGPLPAGLVPLALLHAVARGMMALGDPARAAWRSGEKPLSSLAERMRLLTHDPRRYNDEQVWRAKRPYLHMGSASWRWIERAIASMRWLEAPGVLERVRVPVLALAAPGDGLVDSAAIRRALRRLPLGHLVEYVGARHEILRETDAIRDPALAEIDTFFEVRAPAQAPAGGGAR